MGLEIDASVLTPPTWSADSRFVLLAGRNDNGATGVYRIDVTTGTASQVLPAESGVFPARDLSGSNSSLAAWSPDGSTLYRRVNEMKAGRLWRVSLASHRIADGAEREVYRTPPDSGLNWPDVSADGLRLLTVLFERAPARKYRLSASRSPAETW